MKRFFKISALILVYFLSSARSCDNQEQDDATRNEARVKVSRDSIISAFETDTLSVASLSAFQEAAKQKFSAFTDYLKILTDSATAEPFREQAAKMIGDLFVSGNATLHLPGYDSRKKTGITVEQLSTHGSEIWEEINTFVADSVIVQRLLHRISDSTYTGSLTFTFRTLQKQDIKSHSSKQTGSVDILLEKREKQFGSDTLKVWIIFLGNLKTY